VLRLTSNKNYYITSEKVNKKMLTSFTHNPESHNTLSTSQEISNKRDFINSILKSELTTLEIIPCVDSPNHPKINLIFDGYVFPTNFHKNLGLPKISDTFIFTDNPYRSSFQIEFTLSSITSFSPHNQVSEGESYIQLTI